MRTVWDAWQGGNEGIADTERALASLRDFILRHRSRFPEATADGVERQRDLVGYYHPQKDLSLFHRSGLQEALRGHSLQDASAIIKERGLLALQ